MSVDLTKEQSDACDRLVTLARRSRGVQVFEGPGGSGKSTVMGVVASKLNADGWRTIFTANAHAALGSCPGPGLVLSKLMAECRYSRHPRKTPLERTVARWFESPRRVLVVDEAFQLTSTRLSDLFSALSGRSSVARGGTRVILVGDPGQTKPIGGNPITAHADVVRAQWTRLTSGTMRMTSSWARDVGSFSSDFMLADASLVQFRRTSPPDDAMIVCPTRKEVIEITRALAGPTAVTILPFIPDRDDQTLASPEERKAAEPFICNPGETARLVYNVRTSDGARVTASGFGLNNNAKVQFVGIVDKNGTFVELSAGSAVQMTKQMRVCVRVAGETEDIHLAPHFVDEILVVPLRAWRFKTIIATQGETLDAVHLYAQGKVRASDYVTAAGRVRCAEAFSVARSVTGIKPDS